LFVAGAASSTRPRDSAGTVAAASSGSS
jgi:hypothetical protein